MIRNQIALRSADPHVRLCIGKVPHPIRGYRVRIRTYLFQKFGKGYRVLILEGAHVVSQGFTYDLKDAEEWLDAHTRGICVD